MEEEQSKPESKSALWWSCGVSLLLLIVLGCMQASRSPVMEMKAQWLWVAVLPILIVLITGKYIGKLKGPGIEFEQFKTGDQMRRLAAAPPQAPAELSEARRSGETQTSAAVSDGSWTTAQNLEYRRTDKIFLVHVYEPSTSPNQKYDVTIFLMRHIPGWTPNQRENFSEVEKLELYFGSSWSDAVFTAPNNGGLIGVRTSAWGSFLATGRVIFRDGRPPLILHRYIDFEMASKKI